jgi:caa(3)-type oxidase subunit IV
MEPTPDTTAAHDAHDSHAAPLDFAKTIRTYLKVGFILILFTGITWGVAFIDFGSHALNLGIGLAIATFKVSLVSLIFMHLNHERGLIYKVLLFTVIFSAAMMFLMVLAYLDPIKAALGN